MWQASRWLITLLALAVLGFGFYWYAWRPYVVTGVVVGRPVPDFTLPALSGGEITLSELAGRPLVLRVSSRTCSFCPNDFATLDFLQAQAGERLQIVAIESGAPAEMVRGAAGSRQHPYPILLDPEGLVPGRYQARGLPMYYFLYPDLRLAASYWGDPGADEWRRFTEMITEGSSR